ncbi:MAG TPA: RNA-directed DNA polymerase [Polyangiaceae bacterium]|nr:RNA-directed DNA polymerase [Polyangiaceae bacterium]
MTRRRTLLERGYFPKELPPHFFTEEFAAFASQYANRTLIQQNPPTNGFTECTPFELAAPSGTHRTLSLPHPLTFTALVDVIASNWKKIHSKASKSTISRSKPVYVKQGRRSIVPHISYRAADRDRLLIRSGYRYLLKADVSQFYPTLYSHAIGWAIDKRLRDKRYWRNQSFLGKRIDNAVVNTQGKRSQGLPIGNDVSFLLGELVLSEVDKSLKLGDDRALRWLDDYEIACATREDAERILSTLQASLLNFGLRANPSKTEIVQLPRPVAPPWLRAVRDVVTEMLGSGPPDLDRFFDHAYEVHNKYPDSAVFNYAFGHLFRLPNPTIPVAQRAQGAIMQAVLAEPGCAQKAVAVLTYWNLNGMILDKALLQRTTTEAIRVQANRGFSSDVAWLLFFCIQNQASLGPPAAKLLRECRDDCIALQSLHMKKAGLLPSTFKPGILREHLINPDLDGPHWLLLYEAYRQRLIQPPAVHVNPVFAAMLSAGIKFYRPSVPAYASLIHPGGAPEWLVKQWLKNVTSVGDDQDGDVHLPVSLATNNAAARLIRKDAGKYGPAYSPSALSLALLRGSAVDADEEEDENVDDELDDEDQDSVLDDMYTDDDDYG